MVDLFCTPFADLIQRMRLEFRQQQSLFDLPARKFFVPSGATQLNEPELNLCVVFHNRVAGNRCVRYWCRLI
jgi:hypothetical protein